MLYRGEARDESWQREQNVRYLRRRLRDDIITRVGVGLLWCLLFIREMVPAFLAICLAKYFGVI